eukprot:11010596-Ditylum_brightwellii.AAC.1
MNASKKSPRKLQYGNRQGSEKSDLSDSGLPWLSNKSGSSPKLQEDSNLSSSSDGSDVSST